MVAPPTRSRFARGPLTLLRVRDAAGEPVLWEVVEAVRSWLEAHTLAARPPAEASRAAPRKASQASVAGAVEEVQEAMGGTELSEDDLELDEEDMDAEMVEAVGWLLVVVGMGIPGACPW